MAKGKKGREETPQELVKVGQDGAAPAWLATHAEEDTSIDSLAEHRVLPRLKIIQQMTDVTMREALGEGSVILQPGEVRVVTRDESFEFVPVFFFTEFLEMSDLKDTGSPMILERSFDASSELAKMARDPDQWERGYGTQNEKGNYQFTARRCETLNFVGFICGGDAPAELNGVPVTLIFSRGEFTKGRAFITAITMRRIGSSVAPLWSQRWEFTPNMREKGGNAWYGLDFANAQQPYIDEDLADFMRSAHEEFKGLHESKALVVDHEEPGDAPPQDDGEDVEL